MSANAAGFDFSRFVPGFDFLRQMTQPQGMAAAPSAQWVAPTVDPEEVERRIQELKAVQFWLEQNTTALKATIQALEVQKMTLHTLRSMNVGLSDMAQVFQQAAAGTMQGMGVPASGAASGQQEAAPAPDDAPDQAEGGNATPDDAAAASPVDAALAQAGQWWGSMLQTFQTIALQAQNDVQERQQAFAQQQEKTPQPAGRPATGKGSRKTAAARATPAKGALAKGTPAKGGAPARASAPVRRAPARGRTGSAK